MEVEIDKIDLELLKRQRDSLNEVINDAAVTTPTQSEHLQGLQNLLDHIYDQLVPID